jgi:hypothetical protein
MINNFFMLISNLISHERRSDRKKSHTNFWICLIAILEVFVSDKREWTLSRSTNDSSREALGIGC